MAKPARLIHPISLVGTRAQKTMIEDEARRNQVSQGDVVRNAIDEHFGLVDGEEADAPAESPLSVLGA